MKFGTRVKQSQPFNRDYFHDNRCPIFDFMRFWNCLKNGRGRSNFRKIPAIVLKQHRKILYRFRNFGIKFGQNRLKSWKSDTHAYTNIHIHPDASWKYYVSIQEAKTGDSLTARVKMRHSPAAEADRPRSRVHAAFLHLQWANHPCGLMYRTIFFFTNSCEPELAHRLQTSKMHRNSTSLDSCQHDDMNIVTVSVAMRRWTAPLKPRRPCVISSLPHFTLY